MSQFILKHSLLVVFFLVSFVVSVSDEIGHAQDLMTKFQKERYEVDKLEFSMEWAAKNIAENMNFWIQVHADVDAGTSTAWSVLLSRNIVSQPVAVFEIMRRINVPAEEFCPALFIETDEYIVKQWEEAAIHTLEAFTFVDPVTEQLRSECLQRIRKSYQSKTSSAN